MVGDDMSFSAKAHYDPELNIDVVQLDYTDSNPEKSITARVAPAFGSNLYGLSYGPNELIMCDKAKLADRDWTGTFVLWPLPNRVAGKEYTFEGRTVSLAEIKRRDGNWSLIHGLVDDQIWQYDAPGATDEAATLSTWLEIGPEETLYRFFPFASRLRLDYRLDSLGVRVNYTVDNLGDQTLPYAFALHPYFATLPTPEETQVVLPAEAVMVADDEYLPSGHLRSIGLDGYDLRQPTWTSEVLLDHVYTQLSRDVVPAIRYPSLGFQLELRSSADFTHMVLYTLMTKEQGYICFENQTGSTDAINLHARALATDDTALKDAAHLLEVAAGDSATGFIEYRVAPLQLQSSSHLVGLGVEPTT